MFKKTFISLVFALLTFTFTPAQTKRKPTRKLPVKKPVTITAYTLTPEQNLRFAAFYLVWQTLNDNYFDQTFNGLNWQKIREEYEPRVVKTTTDAQLYAILQEMINRLNRSHFFIIPPEVYKAIETAKIKAKSGAISNSDDAEDSDGNT